MGTTVVPTGTTVVPKMGYYRVLPTYAAEGMRRVRVRVRVRAIHTNGLAGYGFEKSREDKARQGKQEERRPEKTRNTKNGEGFALFLRPH